MVEIHYSEQQEAHQRGHLHVQGTVLRSDKDIANLQPLNELVNNS